MSYMTDSRLTNYKDYTNHSKYAETYMNDKEFYNNAKPFIHLKLDQVCRNSKPADEDGAVYDYILSFEPERVTLNLLIESKDVKANAKLHSWQLIVAERVNSLAIREFRASQAHPEDAKISDMVKDLAIKLENLEVTKTKGGYSSSVTTEF